MKSVAICAVILCQILSILDHSFAEGNGDKDSVQDEQAITSPRHAGNRHGEESSSQRLACSPWSFRVIWTSSPHLCSRLWTTVGDFSMSCSLKNLPLQPHDSPSLT